MDPDEVQEMITANTSVVKEKYSFSKDEHYTLNSQYFNYTISAFYRILNASLVEDENKIDYSFLILMRIISLKNST